MPVTMLKLTPRTSQLGLPTSVWVTPAQSRPYHTHVKPPPPAYGKVVQGMRGHTSSLQQDFVKFCSNFRKFKKKTKF